MAGLGNPRRATDMHRETAVENLKFAFVHGALTLDEFTARVPRVLSAQSEEEVAAEVSDIHALTLGGMEPVRAPLSERSGAAATQQNHQVGASRSKLVAITAASALLASLGTGVAVWHQSNQVAEHCLVRDGNGPYQRVC